MKSKSIAIVTMAVITAAATSAVADEEYVRPTETQLELNQQGLEALSAGEYESAISFFEASLGLGQTNVTLANLGRAHQRAGNCEEAENNYEKVFDAPLVQSPPAEAVAEAVGRYRDEMRENCPGYLDISCDPAEIALYIDEEGPQECVQDEPRPLLPGRYELRGEYEEQVTETTVGIDALQTSRVRLTLRGAEVEEPEEEAIGHVEAPPRRQYSTDGWMWLAASGAALAGGLALDTVPSSANNQQLDATDFVPLGFYGVSLTFGILGIQRLVN